MIIKNAFRNIKYKIKFDWISFIKIQIQALKNRPK